MKIQTIPGFGFTWERGVFTFRLTLPQGDITNTTTYPPIANSIMINTDGVLYLGNGTSWTLPIGGTTSSGGSGAGVFEPVINGSTINTFWNGLKAFVGINADQVTDGTTNKFFAAALVRAAIAGTPPVLYNATTGEISIDLTALDARYAAITSGLGALTFTNGLLLTGTTVTALTDAALWNANKLQGFPVTSENPVDGATLRYNGTTNTWEFYYP